jgi:hypothetical protein
MITRYLNNKAYFQKKSKNQVNARLRKIELGPMPDYPEIIKGKKVQYEIFVFRYSGETELMHVKLCEDDDTILNQYKVWINGSFIYLNRNGKEVLNATNKYLMMGLKRVLMMILSRFPAKRRMV